MKQSAKCEIRGPHARRLRELADIMEEPVEAILGRVLAEGFDAIDSLDGKLWAWASQKRADASTAARVRSGIKRRLKAHADRSCRSQMATWRKEGGEEWRRRNITDGLRLVHEEINQL